MPIVLVSLLAAAVFGAADFFGGIAAKRMSALLTTAVTALVGLVLLVALLPVMGGQWSLADSARGAISGVAGAIAIALLYACLAIGPMSILSPLTAVVSAIVPMVWGLVGGNQFSLLGYAGLGVALVEVFGDGQRVPDLHAALRQAGHQDRGREQQDLRARAGVVARNLLLVEVQPGEAAQQPAAQRPGRVVLAAEGERCLGHRCCLVGMHRTTAIAVPARLAHPPRPDVDGAWRATCLASRQGAPVGAPGARG